MTLPGIGEFLQELESHCHSNAIATFVGSDSEPFVVDLQREGDWVRYGDRDGVKATFIRKLANECTPMGSLILRSFTAETDDVTQLPIKELRGYVLQQDSDRFEFEKLSSETMFACHNTDAQTGEPLALEQSVRYC